MTLPNCPFCGGPMERLSKRKSSLFGVRVRVRCGCKWCHAATDWADSRGEADAKWSARAGPEDAVERMKDCVGIRDPEEAHLNADDILVEVLRSMGYGELCDEYDKVRKWYA